jgi:hypothetical protein
MAYAVGVLIMGIKLQNVEEIYTSLVEQNIRWKYKINAKKTKFIILSRKLNTENRYVQLGTYNFETVKDCTYVGTILTNKTNLGL